MLEFVIHVKPLAFNALLQLIVFRVKGYSYSTQHACQYVQVDHLEIHLRCNVVPVTNLYVNNVSNLQAIALLASKL